MVGEKKPFTHRLPPLGATGSRASRIDGSKGNPALEMIWHMVCEIPAERVSTYGAVARAAGLPGRARLAGRALRVAPEELNLPWHRVLGAGGRIVFPESSREHKEQTRRLRAEGVRVREGQVERSAIIQLDE